MPLNSIICMHTILLGIIAKKPVSELVHFQYRISSGAKHSYMSESEVQNYSKLSIFLSFKGAGTLKQKNTYPKAALKLRYMYTA